MQRLVVLVLLAAGCSRAPAAAAERPRSHGVGAAEIADGAATDTPAAARGGPGATDTPDAPPDAARGALGTTDAPPDAETPPVDPPGFYFGRKIAEPMSYLGADWLDRPGRDAEQRPEHVLDVLGVHDGQTVADVGCGSGYFTVHLARRVGPRGRVFATDLQQGMLDLLTKKLAAQKIANVTPERTTGTDAKLPEGALDLVLLVDVYHELPLPPVTLAQIKRSLAPDGRLALVEYRGEDPNVDIKPEHKTTLAQLRRELSASGFSLVFSDESLPKQRIVVFRPAG